MLKRGRCGKISWQPDSAKQEALQSTAIGNAKHGADPEPPTVP